MPQAISSIFGPVRSGRLGLSLGVDPLGVRHCSLDCVYCEAGPTERLTMKRAPYIPAERILADLDDWLAKGLALPEVITFGGLGEPTLSTELGRAIGLVKERCPDIPVAVLTNSTLFDDPGVRRELALADLVLPSMDTLVDDELKALNRPHPGLTAPRLARGLMDFRAGYQGLLHLEILLIKGLNDSDENLRLLEDFVGRLGPDRVDVVTMTRPGTCQTAKPADLKTLARFQEALALGPDAPAGPGATAKIHAVPDPRGPGADPSAHGSGPVLDLERTRRRIMDSLSRRPQTLGQLAQGLGLGESEIAWVLDILVAERELCRDLGLGQTFFKRARALGEF